MILSVGDRDSSYCEVSINAGIADHSGASRTILDRSELAVLVDLRLVSFSAFLGLWNLHSFVIPQIQLAPGVVRLSLFYFWRLSPFSFAHQKGRALSLIFPEGIYLKKRPIETTCSNCFYKELSKLNQASHRRNLFEAFPFPKEASRPIY